MKKLAILFIPLLAVSLVSCKKENGSATSSTTTATSASDPVVLEVNGEKMLKSEVENAFKALPPQAQQMTQTPEGRRTVADELVKLKLLEQEGTRLGVDKDPETASQLKLETSKVLAAAALKKIASGDEAALKKTYEDQKAHFQYVQARQIVFAYKGSQLKARHGAAPDVAVAEKKAADVAAGLKSGKPVDAFLASSDDPDAEKNKGMMGFILASAPPEIVKAVGNAKPGDVIGPITTTIGVHVFQVQAFETQPFDQAKPALVQQLQAGKVDEVVEGLKKKAKVTYDESFFGPTPAATSTAPSTALPSPAPAPAKP